VKGLKMPFNNKAQQTRKAIFVSVALCPLYVGSGYKPNFIVQKDCTVTSTSPP